MDYVARSARQLGQILRACRQKHQLTQGMVGSRVGVRQSQISSIETRGAEITVDTLYRLLSALDLELVLRDRHTRDKRPTEW
ncbi:MAG: helix-turn-helix domain-containing protein [Steroidobacteraceae bacterium]